MGNVIRVAHEGVDALEETPDPQNYSLLSDEDNVLIKEFERGSGNGDATIDHNLGYIPFFLVYTDIGSGRFRVVNAQSPLGGGPQVYATTTQLVISNNSGADYQYYIFYDDVL